MLQLLKDLTGQPILSLRTSGVIGTTQEPIINPNNLKIEAWFCEDKFHKRISVLLAQDIRDVIDKGMLVNDHEAMTDPTDLVRLQEIIDLKFKLLNLPVVTDTKRKLGKVGDYAIETESMYIKKLYVNQSILKNLAGSGLSIDRTQILEITNKRIVVRDSSEPAAERISQTMPAPATN